MNPRSYDAIPDHYKRSKKVCNIPHTSGIYVLKSSTTGRFYIGATMDLHTRIRSHFLLMCKENQYWKHSLTSEYKNYGIEDIKIYIIETNIDKKDLNKKEYSWVYANKNNPLNINLIGAARHPKWS